MVKIRTRIHDRYSLEFKLWYEGDNLSERLSRYRTESWIFVPASLDINALSYSREQFYSDITNYYRTITPNYLLEELADDAPVSSTDDPINFNPQTKAPLGYLQNAIWNLVNYPSKYSAIEYEYQIKMFCSIFKSAMRERYNLIKESCSRKCCDGEGCHTCDDILSSFKDESYRILSKYAALSGMLKGNVDENLYNCYEFGEEFIINLTELYSYKIYSSIHNMESMRSWLSMLDDYKRGRGYGSLRRDGGRANENLLYRWGVLKKYVESDLFLGVDKRKSGILKEQVYYSIAAGLSMVFATAVAFTFQQKYGNFTMPLFVALVVSYMLKDRIKELVRQAFATSRKLKYFDHKTLLQMKDKLIGLCREGFDIISQDSIPKEIARMRNRSVIVDVENSMNNESVLFYRNLVEIDRRRLGECSEYLIPGINGIFMLNLSSFVKKMDNPEVKCNFCGEGREIGELFVKKIYYINIIFQISGNGGLLRKRYRIAINRDGILGLEEF